MNKMDPADADLVELVEEEIRDLLEKNGFDRNRPIVKGSATKGSKATPPTKTPLWN